MFSYPWRLVQTYLEYHITLGCVFGLTWVTVTSRVVHVLTVSPRSCCAISSRQEDRLAPVAAAVRNVIRQADSQPCIYYFYILWNKNPMSSRRCPCAQGLCRGLCGLVRLVRFQLVRLVRGLCVHAGGHARGHRVQFRWLCADRGLSCTRVFAACCLVRGLCGGCSAILFV